MTDSLAQLKQYLNETLGVEVRPVPWNDDQRLPFFLRDLYSFCEVQLLGASCLLMLDRNTQEQSPAVVRKHMDQVQAYWDGNVIYVRERVTAYNRKRLIEHNLPFLVPGNQMYLPMLGIDLREHFRKLRSETHKFSPSTQALVIHVLLQKNSERVFSPSDMAGRLGYSAMTMTRAFDELESADLGEIFLKGQKRYIRFADSKMDTWKKAQPFLSSPVKKRLHTKTLNTGLSTPHAGLTALANYTMLAEPANLVIALSGNDWKLLKHRMHIKELHYPEPGGLEMEIWRYSPNLFAEQAVVDRLSLYLSLKENQDERVETALEEMMREIQW